ncbi:MAG: hypothetical protein Q7N95_14390, partial [Alphaproteobacteria bacterium]|nr:hypothetical protein [Alphaproteobacteria bacterium]
QRRCSGGGAIIRITQHMQGFRVLLFFALYFGFYYGQQKYSGERRTYIVWAFLIKTCLRAPSFTASCANKKLP